MVTMTCVSPPLRTLHLFQLDRHQARLQQPRRHQCKPSPCLLPHSNHQLGLSAPLTTPPRPWLQAPSLHCLTHLNRFRCHKRQSRQKNATASLAPSPNSSWPTPPELLLVPPRTAAQEAAATSAPPPTSPGPPTPPPWPEAYVSSADPDRIVCHKCCNRHYNYRWYSHCFMCN